jgi:hypothetical protein
VTADLNRALILFAKHPYGAPDRTRAALTPAFNSDDVDELAPRIDALVDEIFAIPVDWSGNDLAAATRAVQAKFQLHHPEITDDAATALANYWSYCNR